MTPCVDDRLDSIIRALSTIILPSLPDSASLAKEQAELIVGHLQILQSQLDQIPGFEQEELEDAITLANALVPLKNDPALADEAASLSAITEASEKATKPAAIREARIGLHREIDTVIKAVFARGSQQSKAILKTAVGQSEQSRITKDRAMLAAFGFDNQA